MCFPRYIAVEESVEPSPRSLRLGKAKFHIFTPNTKFKSRRARVHGDQSSDAADAAVVLMQLWC